MSGRPPDPTDRGADSSDRIRTSCPGCATEFQNVPGRFAGRTVRCRTCGQRFTVPSTPTGPPVGTEPAATVFPASFGLNEPAATIPALGPGGSEPAATLPGDAVSYSVNSPSANDWSPGQVLLNLYQVIGFLGEGGMGRVYRVRHLDWGVDLALKIPRPEVLTAAGGEEGFEREAETWVSLGLHPHVVSCYYIRRLNGRPALFSEYVAGGSLHDWIGQKSRGPGRLYAGGPEKALLRILDLAVQSAWGLEYAHEQGLVHLDVKPANILISDQGLAKVTDFGLAFALGGDRAPKAASGNEPDAQTGTPAGTPQYFSPEQAEGRPLDGRTDLWSWALCLLEMLLGARTWRSGTVAAAALEQYLTEGPPEKWLPAPPAGLGDLLRRCFAADPAERYTNLGEPARNMIEIHRRVAGSVYPRRKPVSGPGTADSLNNRALSLLDLNRRREAEKTWSQALRLQPHHLETVYNQSLLLWRSARLTDEEALHRLRESGRSNPDREAAARYTASVHLERDDCEEALNLLRRSSGSEADPAAQDLWAAAEQRRPAANRCLRNFPGHLAGVLAVTLGRDGDLILSGGEDRTLRLWATRTGRCLKALETPGPIAALGLDREGKLALTGGGDFAAADFSLRLWDLESGRCLSVLPGHTAPIRALVWSPDGTAAVTAGEDKTVRVWDLALPAGRFILDGHQSAVTALDLSHDGRLIFSGGDDRAIRVWDTKTGRQTDLLDVKAGRVTGLSLSRNDRFLAAAGTDQTVGIWDLSARRLVRVFTGHQGEVSAVALAPDGRHLLSAGEDKTVRLWETASGRCLRTFAGHKAWVTSLRLSRDGRYAVSGGLDKAVRLWKADGSAETRPAAYALSYPVSSEEVSQAGRLFEGRLARAGAALSRSDALQAAQEIRAARSLPGHGQASAALVLWRRLYSRLAKAGLASAWEEKQDLGPATAVALDRQGRLALTGLPDGGLRVWDLEARHILYDFRGRGPQINSLALNWNGRLAAAADAGGYIRLWNLKSGRLVFSCPAHAGEARAVSLGPSGQVMSGGDDGGIVLVNPREDKKPKILARHPTAVNTVWLSPDGKLGLAGGGDQTSEENVIRLWSLAEDQSRLTLTGHERPVNAVVPTPDGRSILSAGSDGTIRIWETASGRCLKVLTGHDGGVQALSLAGEGRYFLSGASDRTVRLWDLASGECLRLFEGHSASVISVSLSLDGGRGLSADRTGQAKLWFMDWKLKDLPVGGWSEAARPWLTAFLTERGAEPWSEAGLKDLVLTLGCAGLGRLSLNLVRDRLRQMARTGS
ncbi:MAG: protein kinase [Thermodesulfobacteriota bacterium]